MAPCPARRMCGIAARAHHIGRSEIDAQDRIPRLGADLGDGRIARVAAGRVVDQHREPAEPRRRLVDERPRTPARRAGRRRRNARSRPPRRSRGPRRHRVSALRPVTTTAAPCAANATAIARPIPAVDPVTSARSPSIRTGRKLVGSGSGADRMEASASDPCRRAAAEPTGCEAQRGYCGCESLIRVDAIARVASGRSYA